MMPFAISDRRQFLAASAALAAAHLASQPRLGAAETPPPLRRGQGGDLFRVRMELNVEGNLHVPANPLASRDTKTRLPINSEAVFDYEERFLAPTDASVRSPVIAAERFYHAAESISRIGDGERNHVLRQAVNQPIVRRELVPEVIYHRDDFFTRDELDLLTVPVSSVAVDQLLPRGPIGIGETTSIQPDVLASVLNLTAIIQSDVKLEIKGIDEEFVKMQIEGELDGSVDGVATHQKLIGKLSYDRGVDCFHWVAMAIHEKREAGVLVPGFDLVANVRLLRRPLEQPIKISAQPAKVNFRSGPPEDRMPVELSSHRVGVAALMDRRWRMISDQPGIAVMRMAEDDRSIAQCDFRPLASLPDGKQWTLEAFTQDVRRTLGNQLRDITQADQRVTASGVRALRVAAAGSVEGIPIQWIVLHFSDDVGRRVLATFTMEADNVDRMAGSDLQLADSLQIFDRRATGATDDDETSEEPELTNADAKSAEAEIAEVQSSSDRLR